MGQKLAAGDRQPIETAAPLPSDDTLASRVVELWTRDYLARPLVLAGLAALLIAYLTYLFLLGPVPSTLYGNDVFLLLDGGWRILNGLVPNHDFYLSLGPVTYMWVAAGLWTAHNSANGLVTGLLAFAALIVVFAFLTARTRMTAAGSILFSTFILLLCTGPMHLGGNASIHLTYAMVYNRFGYGLLGILYVTQLLRPKNPSGYSRDDWFGDVVSGATLAILFFLKVSYFGIGAGLVALATLIDRRNIRRLLALAYGLVPVTVGMLAFLRFDVAAVVRDLWDTIHARTAAVSHFGITDLFGLGTTSLVALALTWCFAGRNDSSGRPRIWLFGAAFYTVLAESLLIRTNGSQGGETFPLYIIFIFVLLGDLGNTIRAKQPVSAAFAAALVVLGLSFMAPLVYVHLRSLALLTKYKTSAHLRASADRVEGGHLRDLAFYDEMDDELNRRENGRYYASYLNDGIDLLKKYSTSNDIVATLSFHNPFSYALLRKPPRGGSTWFLLDNNISASYMLSNARMFGDATVVMVPKYQLTSHVGTDEFLFQEYKSYLLSNFAFVAESDQWRLYRRLTR
jgi:hypothetical protein